MTSQRLRRGVKKPNVDGRRQDIGQDMNSSKVERLWGVQDVAAFLGVPAKTIYEWRRNGYGPTGRRVGKYVRFDPAAVRQWFDNLSDDAA